MQATADTALIAEEIVPLDSHLWPQHPEPFGAALQATKKPSTSKPPRFRAETRAASFVLQFAPKKKKVKKTTLGALPLLNRRQCVKLSILPSMPSKTSRRARIHRHPQSDPWWWQDAAQAHNSFQTWCPTISSEGLCRMRTPSTVRNAAQEKTQSESSSSRKATSPRSWSCV